MKSISTEYLPSFPYLFISHVFLFYLPAGIQEDPVLLTPEEKGQKPYVAIIKVIYLLIYFPFKGYYLFISYSVFICLWLFFCQLGKLKLFVDV